MGAGVPDRFDGAALLAAVDAQRAARGLTWAALGRDLGVSPSTVQRFAAPGVHEADGVLAACWWLGRPLEAFAGEPGATSALGAGCWGDDRRVRRVDGDAVRLALDQRRTAEGATWVSVAEVLSAATSAPVASASLRRLGRGRRMVAEVLLAAARWVGQPVEALTWSAPA